MSLFSFFSKRKTDTDVPHAGTAESCRCAAAESDGELTLPQQASSGLAGDERQTLSPDEMNSSVVWEATIASRPEEGKQILEEIVRRLADLGWDEQEIFGVRLALEEAIINAIKHGNGHQVQKQVVVVCLLAQHALRVEIQDEGDGFVPEAVPDPTQPENRERPCGRGLMLMRHYMTRVEYNERGNRVTLEKQRAAG